MANLVSPGYKKNTLVNRILEPVEERVIEFKGLNRRAVVEEGEMPDMKNLTSDNYPLLSPRKLRGTMTLPDEVVKPLSLLSKYGKIAMIAKCVDANDDPYIGFYYNGSAVAAVNDLTEDTRMVAINTRICFFPQKKCLSLTKSGTNVTVGSYTSLEASSTLSAAAVTISNESAVLTVPDGTKYKYDDAINLSGTLSYTPSGGSATTASCNVSCIIESVSGNDLTLPRETFIDLTGAGATSITLTGTATRTMPALDHVIEWNNRLWGCSNADNTIYACKLGDPTNWQYFQGTSLDSYYAQQGSDGDWTGVAGYSGHIIFFKQTSMCRIYGTAPSNFQVTNTDCFGVEAGSRLSVVTINDKVFYKSSIGIMAYDGGVPYLISEKLNTEYKSVVGGTEGIKYYASANKKGGGTELLVLDINRGVWHKEDSVKFRNCCTHDNKLYFVTQSSNELLCSNDIFCSDWLFVGSSGEGGYVGIINPAAATESYSGLEWLAQFGPFDEYMENRKIYSKLALRLKANGPSRVRVYISISEGDWELVKDFDPTVTEGHFIPIVPRRCDRYSVKVEGTGNCEIKSLTRFVRMGTGLKL